MKTLAQMTREELYLLDDDELRDLAADNNMDWTCCRKDCVACWNDYKHELRKNLDTLRLELQQDSADARRESLEDR